MGKFFFKPEDRIGETVTISGNAAHHMLRVLRLRAGEEVTLCDGNATDYRGVVISLSSKPETLTFRLASPAPSKSEASYPITLYQGLPKGDKMDWIIEKCVEAGVFRIIPVLTARTEAKLKDTSKKSERYARIAASAASQSMRGIIPDIAPPISFAEATAECSRGPCLVAYEQETSGTIKKALQGLQPGPISLWVGPEGGFEDSEVRVLVCAGATPITLGPRILRTETAGLVAISQILCIWDA